MRIQFISYYNRVLNAFYYFKWAYDNYHAAKDTNFKLLSDIFSFILEVASRNEPRMVKIAVIDIEGEDEGKDFEFVSLWAGTGAGADPLNRIQDLLAENKLLKTQLRQYDEQRFMD